MKKKTKVCLGAILFTGGSLLLATGLYATVTYMWTTLGLIGITAASASSFGLYYGIVLLRK